MYVAEIYGNGTCGKIWGNGNDGCTFNPVSEYPQRESSGAELGCIHHGLGPKMQEFSRRGTRATPTQDQDLRPFCRHLCANFDRHLFLYACRFWGKHLFLTLGMLTSASVTLGHVVDTQ